MHTIGDTFPEFSLQATVSIEAGQEFQTVTDKDFEGKWKCYFFWPMDFTPVCPTEIAEFGRRQADFADRDCQILGGSIDTQYVHLAWRREHPDLKELPYPMLSDTKRELAGRLGILHRDEGVCLRATFLVDPHGIIRWVTCNDLGIGRSVPETLRVLDALQSDELCPCNWEKGEPTLQG